VNGVEEIVDTVFDTNYNEYIDVTTQFGSDSGLARFHIVDKDALNGNSKLITNRNYYFAVTAYGYNEFGVPKTFESSPKYFSVRPEVPNTLMFGETTAEVGEMFLAESSGPGQGYVEVHVVDPSKLSGDSYSVTFDDYMPTGEPYVNWTLTNTTTGEVYESNNPIIGGINQLTGVEVGVGASTIYDGVQVQVFGPEQKLVAVEEYDAGWKENNVLRDTSVSYLPPSLGRTGYIIENRAGCATGTESSCLSTRDFDRFNYWGSDDVELDFSETSVAWDYIPETVLYTVPFSMYRHNFATGEKERMFPMVFESDGIAGYSNSGTTWAGPVYGAPAWEPIYAVTGSDANSHYDPANEAQYIADNSMIVSSGGCGWFTPTTCGATTTSGEAIYYPFMTSTLFTAYLSGSQLPTAEGHAAYGSAYDSASSVVFRMAKPISFRDTFTFSTTGLEMMATDYDPDNISVWPNPYYGYNPEERDALDRRVMFSHLPTEGPSTIRIFALDGTLVRTIKHNDTGSQHTYWDMKNNFEIPVASGMYIAHVETNRGDKILKLAVIQPEQRLDVY